MLVNSWLPASVAVPICARHSFAPRVHLCQEAAHAPLSPRFFENLRLARLHESAGLYGIPQTHLHLLSIALARHSLCKCSSSRTSRGLASADKGSTWNPIENSTLLRLHRSRGTAKLIELLNALASTAPTEKPRCSNKDAILYKLAPNCHEPGSSWSPKKSWRPRDRRRVSRGGRF